MLQPHSFLWHYLWVGPHVLEVALAVLLWRRGLHKLFPFFFAYLVYDAVEELTLWTMDVVPLSWVSVVDFWRAFCAGALIEGPIKFAFVLELFSHLVRPRPAVAKRGNWMMGCSGAGFAGLAAWAAAHANVTHKLPIIADAQVLEQTIFIIEGGLLLFVFVFAAYYHLAWNRWNLGIAVGASISACVHLASLAIVVNSSPLARGYLLDFLAGATYHVCVLIWFYYLLSPVHPFAARAENGASAKKPNGPIDPAVRRLRPAWLLALLQG